MHKKSKILYIVLLYTICLILIGCNSNTKENQSKNSQGQQKKEIASALGQMEENTEKLIQDLWYKREYAEGNVKETEEFGKQEGKDTSDKEDQGNEGQNKEEQGQENQRKETEEQNSSNTDNKKEEQKDSKDQGDSKEQDKKADNDKKQQPQSQGQEGNGKPKNWDDIGKNIEKLHIDWNSYEPEARKDGATNEMIDGVKKQLNTLSEKVETKDVDIVLQETNKLYAHYPQFFNLYKHNAPPEIKKMKALTRQIILDAQAQRWNNTDMLLADMKTTWITAKSRMQNADISLNEKIDCAIDDLVEVTNEKKNSLTRLKGDILLQNLEQLK